MKCPKCGETQVYLNAVCELVPMSDKYEDLCAVGVAPAAPKEEDDG